MKAGTASLEKKKKRESEDNEAKAIGDALHTNFGVHERCGHHEAHDSEDY